MYLYDEGSSHDDEEIAVGQIDRRPFEEAAWKILPEEDYVRFDQGVAVLARGGRVGHDERAEPRLRVWGCAGVGMGVHGVGDLGMGECGWWFMGIGGWVWGV